MAEQPRLRPEYKAAAGLTLVLVAWMGARSLQEIALRDRDHWPDVEEYVILPPASQASIAYLGYRQAAADITWARALVYYGSSTIGSTDFRYLEQFIDNVVTLDPKFKRAYSWAAAAVTHKRGRPTQKEFRTSVRYLEMGMKQFPDDFELINAAGGRYWFDLVGDTPEETRKLRERGAELYEQSLHKKNAPPGHATFVASLHTTLGKRQRALQMLREQYLTTDNKAAQKKILERFRYLAEDLDITSDLDRAKKEFDRKRLENLPFAAPALFVIIGERPDPIIDFERLANDRDLAGATSSAPE